MHLIEFLVESVSFLLAVICCFYIPGRLFLELIKKDLGYKNILSISIGIIIFTLADFILGYLGLRIVLYLLLLISIALFLKILEPTLPHFVKFDKFLITLILAGAIIQNLITFPSGILFKNKMLFWGVSGRDGVWYISLTEELKKHIPPNMPSYSGEKLKSYHYFLYLTEAEVSNITGIPSVDLNFRYFPILISLLFGSLIFSLIKKITNSNSAGYLSVFISYFSGSFGYIPRLLHYGTGSWETAFWSMQPFSMLQNPQLAISFVFLTLWLIFLLEFLKSRANRLLIPLVIISCSLPEFKVFAGILVLGSMMVISIIDIVFFKKKNLFLATLTSSIIAFLLFIPNARTGMGYFIFEPLWFIRTMIVTPDRLGWEDLELRKQTYAFHNNWPKVFLINIISVLIFITGNLGTKVLGFLTLKGILDIKDKNKLLFNISVLIILLVSLTTPMLFLQSGVVWNSIQFFYYFVFIFGLMSGIALNKILINRSKFVKLGILFITILLSIPTSVELIFSLYGSSPSAYISQNELSALQYLKSSTPEDSVILTYPYEQTAKNNKQAPLPVSIYDSTSYVSAFASRYVYFADELMAGNTGLDIKKRQNNLKEFYNNDNPLLAKKFLKDNKINYIYFLKTEITGQKIKLSETELNAEIVYSNDEAKILKIN